MADEPNNYPSPPFDGGQSVLPDDIRESIALGSFCAITGQPSSLSNLAYSNAISNNNLTQQNTVANQQAMNQVANSVLGNAVNLVANLSAMEAVAVVKMDTGNDISQQLMDLKAAIDTGGGGPRPGPGPTPKQPLNPTPNPKGGGITVTPTGFSDFPINIVVDDSIPSFSSVRLQSGGVLLNVNRDYFPVDVRFKDSTPEVQTIFEVGMTKFPVRLNLGLASSGVAPATETAQGETILAVSRDKFPVRITRIL